MEIKKNGIREFQCAGCGAGVIKRCTKTVKYCGPSCFHKYGKKGRPKTGTTKSCKMCFSAFYAPAAAPKTRVFCGKECADKFQSRNKKILVCQNCKKDFKISPSFLNHGNRKYCSIQCRNDDPLFKQRLILMNQAQSGNSNNFEKSAYSLLDEMGIAYERQFLIGKKFLVDAFLPLKDLVIQFDGDYWHGNPEKFSELDKRQSKRVALDISQDAYMKAMGLTVLRIWQSEFKNIELVKAKIKGFTK